MNFKKNNSGFVLLLSIVLIIFLGLMLEASSLRINIELQMSLNRLASQQAFYAADSGLQATVNQLGINSSFSGFPALTQLQVNNSDTHNTASTAVGFYTVAVEPAPEYGHFQSVWVESTGSSNLPNFGKQVFRSILANVVVESPAHFFISTAGDLHVTSGASIDNSILGNNIYFEVDRSLASPDITIDGTVFYLGSVHGNSNPDVTIKPPGSDPKTSQSPTETFSGVDLDSYSAIAQNGGMNCATNPISSCDGEGNLTVSGDNISTTSLDAPNGVVYAPGNIIINGTVDSSLLFVAGGNVIINGNVQVSDSNGGSPVINPQDDPNAPQIGLLAKGDVIISDSAPSDNLNVDAFVMADGETSASQGGVFLAQGTPLTRGTLNMTGSIAVRGTNVATAVNLNAYGTRNYHYNTQFETNLKIPFLPTISAIVSWKEVNPNPVTGCKIQSIPNIQNNTNPC